ncbi:PilZ domain-containing protein [Colwellia sp. 1_MG-2023]|uniref:PilZ domain-containing protein n=1 Tax=Colwellia sp. 1_MG-2023 TaxID=3062649 RepID=UPI0026E12606|nr:PilZ domain-containing protein [Colwellia sp. 1_MG-2023]MDO6446053.1 PilZ domain-containing protein [Colwellia sp. 1_MG-2023]
MEHLYLEFVNDRDLYQSYMPFVKNGGLFVRTTEQFELDVDIELEVLLPDSLEPSQIIGKVCWLTPIGVQNGTPAGIGITFVEDPDNMRSQIEKAIGRLLNSSDATLTM